MKIFDGSKALLEARQNTFTNYAGSESCRDCHKAAYDLWATSHHALAERTLQPAMDQSAFEPAQSFKHGDQTSQVRIKNGDCEIVTLGFHTNVAPYRVDRVLGHEPLRQFLTPAPGGRWQVQEVSYALVPPQWFDVYGDEDRQPGEWGHWTGRGMNWNSQCADCHNTSLRKNYDAATDSYQTQMAEMGVGCEACHGPMKAHVEWSKAHPDTKQKDPNIKPIPPVRMVGACGTCHARRNDLTGDFKPGDSFFDHYSLQILDDTERWYPDGQIHDEDYEFTSFLSSKMYQAGVKCLDCHNPHSMKRILPGNDLCMRCHTGALTNAPVINLAEHGHHKLDDKGGECIGCHMPTTVYMQHQPRHDHGFTIPDPLLTKQLNIPNACNRCHTETNAAWALGYTEQWYGTNMNRHTRERAQWIAAAEKGEAGVQARLISMLSNGKESPYWRAVAANFLWQWAGETEVKAALLERLKDEHPLVRENAVRSLEPLTATPEITKALQPMLTDPVRNVRVAAAWVLRSTVSLQSQAGRELQQTMDFDSDQPTGQYKNGLLQLSRRQPAKALEHFAKAVEWDSFSPPFRSQMAEVLLELGHYEEAAKHLEVACQVKPQSAELQVKLGLAWAAAKNFEKARGAAQRALQIQPDFEPAKYLLKKLPAAGR